MKINSRRDAGYTVISRFEETFRDEIVNELIKIDPEFFPLVTKGAIDKANERGQKSEWEDFYEFMHEIDFPDLKEICLYSQNYKFLIKDLIDKEQFESSMNELYSLRCKIAHVKGFFTSVDLDKLIELTSEISIIFSDSSFKELINELNRNPEKVLIKIPMDFIEDHIGTHGIISNLPIPDYDYEGGFVGRDDDKKKVKQYLKSPKIFVTTITGAGGVGKTSLALKILQEITLVNPDLFDSILWLSAKENKLSALGIEDIEPTLKSYEELLDTIINVFEFADELDSDKIESKEELTNTIIECCKNVLIVIDNLETITDERIINFIFDAPPNVKFLITSRKGIGQLERRHELKQLKEKEAIYLFRQLAKDKQLSHLVKIKNDVIKKYVQKVSYFPLAIKWVLGQVARGKDINKIISSINEEESDISKFCFEQIFTSLPEKCKNVLYALTLTETPPTKTVLQHISNLDDNEFDDAIEDLILVSLLIPEQFQNESKEISTKFTLLPLTKGFIRLQLNKYTELKLNLSKRISEIESTVSESQRATKEYKHSLYNYGAKTDEEKIATIISQTAFQKYQNGNYLEAVEDYKRSIKLAPNFAPLYRNWGVMESYENHLQEAISLMEKAAEIDPSDPQIFLLWGNIYRKNSKFNDAHEKYSLAFKLSSEDPIILNAFGQAKSRLGQYEEAHRLLRKSAKKRGDFSSLKHDIITKTSLAENLINWGVFLTRDKNFGSAERKFDLAIHHCHEAIKLNVRDSKIFTALTKAHLKKAHLLLQMNNENGALNCYRNIIESTDRTFKHSTFKLTALIDLIDYYSRKGKFDLSRKYLKEVNKEYKYKNILRNPKFAKLSSKLKYLKSTLDIENRLEGTITEANDRYDYIIIEIKGSEKTYIAGPHDFVPNLNLISSSLRGSRVTFKPKEFIKEGKQKTQAKYIKITKANN